MGVLEFRLKKPIQPLTSAWQKLPVVRRGSTRLGFSFRPLQAAAFGLEVRPTLQALLTHPFQIVRLGAYWNRMEPEPGLFQPDELDWQVETAERAGKQIILSLGPLKNFGYPEFFVPGHYLRQPFPEHKLIKPSEYPGLLQAAIEFINRLVERYKQYESIIAWQLEHAAIDTLGVEHTWRLETEFVTQEVAALRKADATRPVIMNGYLPTTSLLRLWVWSMTHDQGDSLALAQRIANIVGIDYYPRFPFKPSGNKTLYYDGSQSPWLRNRIRKLLPREGMTAKRLMITEGQAEPWEVETVPTNPINQGLFSCLPEHLISNYNTCMGCVEGQNPLYAYLFWGAEYWLLRKQSGDPSYLQTFDRILEKSS